MTVHNPFARPRLALTACALAVCVALPLGAEPQAAPATSYPPFDGLHVRHGDVDARLHLLTQLRDEVGDAGSGWHHAAKVRMARALMVISALDGKMQVMLHGEFAGTPKLLDAIVRMRLGGGWELAAGQMIAPFTRQFMTPAPRRQIMDFGMVHERFNLNRRIGAMLSGALHTGLELQLGVFDAADVAAPAAWLAPGGWPLTVARLVWTPLGPVAADQVPSMDARGDAIDDPTRLAIGLGGSFRPLSLAGTGPRRAARETRGNLEVQLTGHGRSLTIEGFAENLDAAQGTDQLALGAYAQAGVFLLPARLELFARGGIGDDDTAQVGSGSYSYEGGANVYLATHHLKLGLRFRHDHAASRVRGTATGDRDAVAVQLQGWL